MDKKALSTQILGKIILVLLALAILAWILYKYIIQPIMKTNIGI